MPFLTFLLTPFGRAVAIGLVMMAICVGAYFKIQRDAIERNKAREHVLEIKRLQNALDADERVRRSLSDPDGLRANDGFRRD